MKKALLADARCCLQKQGIAKHSDEKNGASRSLSSQVRLFRFLAQLGPNLAQLGASWSQLGPTCPNLNLKIAQDGPKMRQVRPT